jgi:hypothetical protein
MNATNQQKLVNAGFTIIRKEDHVPGQLRIKVKGSGSHEWKTLEKGFPTKAAVDRRMNELLNDPKTVED